jgi:integrase
MPRIRIKPDSELTRFAIRYAVERGRADQRMLISHCRRFEALIGVVPIKQLNDAHMYEYRIRAARKGLSPNTTEKLLIDVRTIVRAATGNNLMPGRECRRSFKPTKLMIAATKYTLDGGLATKALTNNCRQFFSKTGDLFGDIDPADVQAEHFVAFRRAGLAANLSRVTIEKVLTDVATVCRSVTGKLPDSGKRLRRSRPQPKPAPMESIEAVFNAAPEFMQQWLVITTWTGARITDSMKLQNLIQDEPFENAEFITFQASKTGKHHVWPIPDWLRPWLRKIDHKFRPVNACQVRTHRNRLTECCATAGVPIFKPKQLRQRAISQWTRANGAAGAIVHGKSLGVMDSYVDQAELLKETMPRVIMPDCFKLRAGITPATLAADDPYQMFQTLDEKTRGILLQTMRALLAAK